MHRHLTLPSLIHAHMYQHSTEPNHTNAAAIQKADADQAEASSAAKDVTGDS